MELARKIIAVLLFIFTLGWTVSCEQPDQDNHCKCKDSNGNLVVDTVYYMEPDQAYQLCDGKEGTSNIVSCECTK